jgi:hypothetical protein
MCKQLVLRPLSLLLLALLQLAAASCSSDSPTVKTKGGVLVDQDGNELSCMRPRDPDVINKVVFGRILCTATSQCPGGSFCTAGPGGICALDCGPNLKCGTGQYCSCNGQCLSLTDPPDGGADAPVELACPKDLTLLADPKTKSRVCRFDDECPYGAHCDLGRGRCSFKCVADSECGTNNVCDCSGRCAPANSSRTAPNNRSAVLDVQPRERIIPQPARAPGPPYWEDTTSREVSVSLTASGFESVDPMDATLHPIISVQPDPNLKIKCEELDSDGNPLTMAPDGTPIPPAQFQAPGEPCQLRYWSYKAADLTGAAPRATNRVTAEPVAPANGIDHPTEWTIRMGANGVVGSPVVVRFGYAESDLSLDPTPWKAKQLNNLLGSSYVGTAVLKTPLGGKITLPVKARSPGNGTLYFIDDSRLLSLDTLFSIRGDLNTGAGVWFDKKDRHVDALIQRSSNEFDFNDEVVELRERGLGGKLHGVIRTRWQFTSGIGTLGTAKVPVELTFDLDPAGSDEGPVLCGAMDSCPSPLVCDTSSNLCLDEDVRTMRKTLPKSNSLLSERWYSAMPTYNAFPINEPRDPNPITKIWCATPDWNTFIWDDILFTSAGLGKRNLDRSESDFMCNLGGKIIAMGPVPLTSRPDLETARRHFDNSSFIFHQSTSDLFRRCWDEMRREPPGTLNKTFSRDMAAFKPGIFDFSAECINLGHFLLTMNQQFTTPDAAKGARLIARLLQQYLEVDSFVLRQGLEELALNDAASSALPDPNGFLTPPPPLHDLIDNADMAFIYFLNEFVGNNRNQMIGDFRDPDYRRDYIFGACNSTNPCRDAVLRCQTQAEATAAGLSETHCVLKPESRTPSDVQGSGLAPTILDTLVSYYRAVERHLMNVSIETYGMEKSAATGLRREAAKRYGRAMHVGMFLEGLVADIVQDAYEDEPLSPPPPGDNLTSGRVPPHWYNRFKAASEDLAAARNGLLKAARILGTAENPLGIPDDDVPLFFGDVAGTNSRYFASSDYLLGSWAEPAVKSAQAALQSARDSWKAARDSEIQTELLKADSERRQEAISLVAGTKILDACGNVEVDGRVVSPKEVLQVFKDRGITADRCFLKSGPACASQKEVFANEESRKKFLGRNFSPKAASTMLCRLDYLSRATNGELNFAKQAPWNCFLSSGTAKFCHTCKDLPNPSDQTLCYDSCVPGCDVCEDWTPGDVCRQKCDFYSFAGCQALKSTWNIVSRWCTDFNFLGFCSNHAYQHLANLSIQQVPTAKILADGRIDPESKELNGNERMTSQRLLELQGYIRDCLGRNVSGNNPPGRSGQPGTVWQSLNFDRDTLALSSQMSVPNLGVCSTNAATFYGLAQGAEKNLENLAVTYPDIWADASAFCGSRGWDEELPVVEIPPGCFAGRIGTAVSSVRSAAAEGKAAMADLSKSIGDMNDQLRACELTANLSNEAREALHEYLMRKREAQSTAFLGSYIGAIVTFNVSRATELLLSEIGNEELSRVEGDYQEFVQKIESVKELFQCRQRFNEIQRGITGARWRVKGALARAAGGVRDYNNLIEETQRELDSGAAALAREKERPAGDYAHHFWYDEKVERYRKEFDWAQRMTYLAMRAVEFEFQQYIPLRRQVLAAKHPDALEDVLRALHQEQASRAINRRRPEEASVVLSLRDDVFQVSDRSAETTAGERNWTPALRFRDRLWSSEFELRNKDGQWLGQGVPFSLRESGVLENRCGERMWRVTATVQGDGLSPLEPGTSLVLMKRNTFSSQYCQTKGDGSKYQVVSIRPSNQLFKGEPSRSAEETDGFSVAALYPWFNVRRHDFFSLKYQEGASEELAGRGLYGDYVLVFPRQVLEKGFPLENVEDVLLRIDYLSVDNLAPVTSEELKQEIDLGPPQPARKVFKATKQGH